MEEMANKLKGSTAKPFLLTWVSYTMFAPKSVKTTSATKMIISQAEEMTNQEMITYGLGCMCIS